jgi:pyruvate decarboxylase
VRNFNNSFVLNNSGYTIERLIHGKTAPYNTVAVYDYSKLAEAFGPGFPSKYYGRVETAEQLIEVLGKEELVKPKCFSLIELVLEPLDAPQWVLAAGKAVEEFNARKSG